MVSGSGSRSTSDAKPPAGAGQLGYGSPGAGPEVASSRAALSRTDRVRQCSTAPPESTSPYWGPSELRPRVGVMLQSGGIPPSVPAADYLTLLSRFHAHPVAVPALLDLVGLTAVARTPYKRLSGGQQQRLSLAAAVIGRPELVFLDEPTAGMDPQARHATWDLIGQLRSAGVSIILTTHFMEEAERLCDYVAIIDHGQLVAAGTPGQLTGTVGQLRFRAEPGLDIESLLAALPPTSLAKESPAGHYLIEVHGAVDPLLLAAVTAWCAERGVLATSLRIESRTLEDVFLELTGKELRA